jgi:hypothetical protein
MECAVYDTYVRKNDGKTMHFDVVGEATTTQEKAIEYGKQASQALVKASKKWPKKNVSSVISRKHHHLLKEILCQKVIISKKWQAVHNKGQIINTIFSMLSYNFIP